MLGTGNGGQELDHFFGAKNDRKLLWLLGTWESSPERGGSEDVSRKSIIATLRLRIKRLEERNRELTERLERAYGVIAEMSQVGSAASNG
jgi:hypothetical protein